MLIVCLFLLLAHSLYICLGDVTVEIGTNASLECKHSYDQPYKVQWMLDGSMIADVSESANPGFEGICENRCGLTYPEG